MRRIRDTLYTLKEFITAWWLKFPVIERRVKFMDDYYEARPNYWPYKTLRRFYTYLLKTYNNE